MEQPNIVNPPSKRVGHPPMNRYIYTENDPVNSSDPSGNYSAIDGLIDGRVACPRLRGHAWRRLVSDWWAARMQIEPPRIHVFDAFGNAMTARASTAGVFAWRGGEGSVTDKETNLVLMQARHYDPTLGRFLQADTLRLASFTTQGMNRYIYTENDPVTFSDPTGRALPVLAGALAGVLIAVAFGAGFVVGLFQTGPPPTVGRALAQWALGLAVEACFLATIGLTLKSMLIAAMGTSIVTAILALLGAPGLFVLGISFLAGFVTGAIVGTFVMNNEDDVEEWKNMPMKGRPLRDSWEEYFAAAIYCQTKTMSRA